MLALQRHQMILEYLKAHGAATTKQLSELTGGSLATLRRDLNTLSSQGLLVKTHGGAQASAAERAFPADVPGSSRANPPKADPFLSFKAAIAGKAAELIASGDTIFIGAGMTCNLLCRCLNEKEPAHLTVVTTNVTAVIELAQNPNISTLLLGGNIHTGTNHIETLDEYTVSSLEQLYFDKAFITVDGIDRTSGYSIVNRAQLPLYHHLLKNSQALYLLANEGKFDKRTFTHLCGLDDISHVITNACIPGEYLEYYREAGIELIIAEE